jgi:hypothetical protein
MDCLIKQFEFVELGLECSATMGVHNLHLYLCIFIISNEVYQVPCLVWITIQKKACPSSQKVFTCLLYFNFNHTFILAPDLKQQHD